MFYNQWQDMYKRCRYRFLLAATLMLGVALPSFSQTIVWNPNHSVGPLTGVYNISYNHTIPALGDIYPATLSGTTGISYRWEQSFAPTTGFLPVALRGTGTSYISPFLLTKTTYFRRKTFSTANPANFIYSNVIKITMVSANWEDVNYVREHDVRMINTTSWDTVDLMAIGQKAQTTTYLDGLGRTIEKVDRETATPAAGTTLWGDYVRFFQYDAMGREPQKYLPYTTTNQSGQYKTSPLTDQSAYYTAHYNETSAFDAITFDNSPMNRVKNVKESGASWAAGPGDGATYDVNDATDNVQIFSVDYVQGDAPVNKGAYAAGLLFKMTYTDENGKMVVEYTDKRGKLVLKKVQIDAAPGPAHVGWICMYSVYDDFGMLRYQIQPEGVKYLDANNWSFAGTNGALVLAEQCFQYNYDDKGRNIWKKAPGVSPANMLYDTRDRLVLTQDGNQAALSTPQWTASLFDELDRNVITTLYNTTETIANLQTDITNAPTTTSLTISNPGAATVTTVASLSPVSASSLNNAAITTPLKYLFYDNYTFGSVKPFDNTYTNLNAYNTSDPNVLPIATSLRTSSMPTGNMTRVLGTNTFLAATQYYDEKSWPVQTLTDNIKGGNDITTLQRHFDGRILSTCKSHTAPGTGYTNFVTLTKNLFDKQGRVTSVQKQYGTNVMKTASGYDYDDMGRIITKHLDPGYNNPNSGSPDLESLNYSFNIHNQITGINKDYALKTPATYNKWGHFFGLYLGYDNRDNVFSAAQLNGQVSGQQWNTQGDDAQRKYDYTYDNAGRLINALYNEQGHPGDGWSNSKMDFSVSGTSGQITYDYNGNLLTMLQKGITPGTPTPVIIDDLRYAYGAYSNKLQSVTDQMPLPNINGQAGDFKDGTNAAGTPDYVYDANGNLVVDLNKNAQSLNNGAAGTNGIHYNFLDKPDQIRIVGKGTIEIVYSADGEKLQRAFIPESGGASTLTTYINEFVYQQRTALTLSSPAPFGVGAPDTLSYIGFEDGRIRVMTPVSQGNGLDGLTESGNITLPNSRMGAWDYYIMDFQKNVRMILTEETHTAVNTCTMETTNNRPAAEDPVFGQPGPGNEVETTRVPTPLGWQSVNTSASVSQLGKLAGATIGPNTLQKVMAGDQITASVQYYYAGAVTNSSPNIIPNILNSLAAAIGGSATAGTLLHGSSSAITSQLGGTPAFINAVEPAGAGGTTPQAFLTILFFDERFNLIATQDGGVVQQQVASSWTTTTAPLGLTNIKAPKNGYAYVYVSNRSDQSVYFDNLAVGIVAGNIIEEDHYYAFGLKIAGISSKKLGDAGEGTLKNTYLYNDKELFDDGDINWYDYGFRNYDPQIGRFVEVDPLVEGYPFLSPYQYAGNDPITNIDEDGLDIAGVVGGVAEGASDFFKGSQTINQITAVVTAIRPAVAAASGGSIVLSVSSIVLKSAIIAGNLINNKMLAEQAGDHDEIYRRGLKDAWVNANLFGVPDLVARIWGNDPLNDYDNDGDRQAYLEGRAAGNALAIIQATAEVTGGTSTAAGGLATGPGAAVISTAGVAVAGHGAAVGGAASADVAWYTVKALKLGLIFKMTGNNPSNPASNNSPNTNNQENLKYAPTIKHRKGGGGTEMDLDDATASKVLNNSILGGKQRYSWFNKKLYEFQPDNTGGWHGYPIKGGEAPAGVLKALMQRGDINKAQYNRLIQGKL